MKLVSALLLTIALVSGCASFNAADRGAREAALIVHRQLITFKAELRSKIGAERKYYRQAIQTLESSRSRTTYVDLQRSMIMAAQQEAAAMHKTPTDVTDAALAASLGKHAKETIETLEVGVKQMREQRRAHEASLNQLKELEREYGGLEETLVELTIPLDRRRKVGDVARFIDDIATHYRHLAAAEKQKDQSSPLSEESGPTPRGGD